MRGPHARFCERKDLRKLFLRFTYSIGEEIFMGLEQKVELVRQNVISAVQKYKDELVGRKFL